MTVTGDLVVEGISSTRKPPPVCRSGVGICAVAQEKGDGCVCVCVCVCVLLLG